MRGGRSLDSLDAFASKCRAGCTELGAAGERVAFLAISVDDNHRAASQRASKRWPNLDHYWIDAEGISQARIAFVPNRAVVDGRSGEVLRWWDGTEGQVLRGPHGASRTNGSHGVLRALRRAVPRSGPQDSPRRT